MDPPLPRQYSARPERPMKLRKKSVCELSKDEEKVARTHMKLHCTKRRKPGHNARTCPLNLHNLQKQKPRKKVGSNSHVLTKEAQAVIDEVVGHLQNTVARQRSSGEDGRQPRRRSLLLDVLHVAAVPVSSPSLFLAASTTGSHHHPSLFPFASSGEAEQRQERTPAWTAATGIDTSSSPVLCARNSSESKLSLPRRIDRFENGVSTAVFGATFPPCLLEASDDGVRPNGGGRR
nr:uncharacterized protein LOC109158417 [Ipomoea trifida]